MLFRSPVAELAHEGFTGTVADLHARLSSMVSDSIRRSVRWPKAPNILSNALRRISPSLCSSGIELQFGRNDERGRRMISVLDAAAGRKHRQSSSVISENSHEELSFLGSPAMTDDD